MFLFIFIDIFLSACSPTPRTPGSCLFFRLWSPFHSTFSPHPRGLFWNQTIWVFFSSSSCPISITPNRQPKLIFTWPPHPIRSGGPSFRIYWSSGRVLWLVRDELCVWGIFCDGRFWVDSKYWHRYLYSLIAFYHELESAAIKPVLVILVLIRIRINAHELIYYFLYFLTRLPQLRVLRVDVLDHLQVELLVVGVFLQGILLNYGLHEVPNLFLHILRAIRNSILWLEAWWRHWETCEISPLPSAGSDSPRFGPCCPKN